MTHLTGEIILRNRNTTVLAPMCSSQGTSYKFMRINKRLARDGDTSSYVTFVGMLVDQVTTFRKCTTEMQLREAFFGDDGEN